MQSSSGEEEQGSVSSGSDSDQEEEDDRHLISSEIEDIIQTLTQNQTTTMDDTNHDNNNNNNNHCDVVEEDTKQDFESNINSKHILDTQTQTEEEEEQESQQLLTLATTTGTKKGKEKKTWFVQQQIPGWNFSFQVSKVLCKKQSAFQEIEIIEVVDLEHSIGQALILDGQIQSSTKDEFIYHESLVHPSMIAYFAHKNSNNKHEMTKTTIEDNTDTDTDTDSAKRGLHVFVGGGGECATVREILKYKNVSRVVMCDLDQQVIEECAKHLPSMTGGQSTFDDDRLQIFYCTVHEYFGMSPDINSNDNDNGNDNTDMNENKNKIENKLLLFDVIIMDVCDPIECGPAIVCYYQSFYAALKRTHLSKHGVFVTQSSAADLMLYHECMTVIMNTVQSVFGERNTFCYSMFVPCFFAEWSFVMAFNDTQCIPAYLLSTSTTMNTNTNTNTNSDSNSRSNVSNNASVDGDLCLVNQLSLINATIDREIKSKTNINSDAAQTQALQWYDGEAHFRMFCLPKFLRRALKQETRVMTEDTPVFMST